MNSSKFACGLLSKSLVTITLISIRHTRTKRVLTCDLRLLEDWKDPKFDVTLDNFLCSFGHFGK